MPASASRRLAALALALLAGAVLAVPPSVRAQEPSARAQDAAATSDAADAPTLALSLADALARARDGNFRLRQADAGADAARARARQALAAFLPQVRAGLQGVSTTNPLNAFGILLQQEAVTQADFAPPSLNDPDRIENFTTEVTVEQPIFSAPGFYGRRAATHAARAAEAQATRADAQVAFRVKEGYFGLVLAREREGVIATALEAARANARQAQNLFDEGVINRADLLAARVRVADLESRQTEAAAARAEASDRLRYLLGLEDAVTIRPTDALARREAPTDALPSVAEVNARRSDMRALRARRAAAAAQARAQRSAFLPSVGAFGGYMWNDAVPLGTQGESWMVGAKLSWTLFGGFENVGGAQAAAAARRRADVAVRDQALLNAVDVAAARRDLAAARQRLDQAARAVAQAEESLRIRTDRFGQGLARTTDVLQAEATLAEQRLRRLQALYAHTLARYRLELLTETDLTETDLTEE